jgi:hypothetical protein
MADDQGKQTTLAEDEKAMGAGGGSGAMIGAIVICVLLAIGIGVFVMRGDGSSEYRNIGRQVNGMRQQHFDMFWSCALPREDIRDLGTNAQVQAAVLQRASSSPSAYSHIVRACMTNLTEQTPLLTQLIVPPDMNDAITQLRTALASLVSAWNAYLDYLEHLGGPYDDADEQGTTLLTAVVRGWYDYRTAIGAVNDVVRSHTQAPAE